MTDARTIHPAEAHLNADLLTGFAEGLLMLAECELCLQHLAGCADCRQVAFAAQAGLAPILAEEPEFQDALDAEPSNVLTPLDHVQISAVDAAAARRAEAGLQAANARSLAEAAEPEPDTLPIAARIAPSRPPKVPLWRSWIGSLALACAAVACAAVVITVSHKHPADEPSTTARVNAGEPAPRRSAPPPNEPSAATSANDSMTSHTMPDMPAPREPKVAIGSANASAIAAARANAGPKPVHINPQIVGSAAAQKAVAPVNGMGSIFARNGTDHAVGHAPTMGTARGFGRMTAGGAPGSAARTNGAAAYNHSTGDLNTESAIDTAANETVETSNSALPTTTAPARQPNVAAAAPPPAPPPVLHNAQLHGTVTDARGDAIANASITLRGPDGSASGTAATNAQGVFLIGSLAPGMYQLAVTARGFQPITQPVRVTPGSGATVSPELEANGSPTPIHIVPSSQPAATAGSAPVHTMSGAMMPRKPTARVSLGDRALTLDSTGSVGLQIGSSAERPVAAPWTGHAIRLDLTDVPPRQFQVTTASGQVWLSADGEHWQQR